MNKYRHDAWIAHDMYLRSEMYVDAATLRDYPGYGIDKEVRYQVDDNVFIKINIVPDHPGNNLIHDQLQDLDIE